MPPTLADAWLHDLGPFALRFSESLGIRWYGLAYAAGFLIGYLLLRGLARRGLVCIPLHRCGDVMLTVIVGVVVGGRLGYVLLYEPSLLWAFSADPPWWGVLAINRGGMASHGGIAGVILAAWRVSRGWKRPDGTVEGRCPPLHVMDVFSFLAPIGLGLGRLANFVNGELLGRIAALPGEPSPWWTVKFPQEVLTRHPSGRSEAQSRALDDLVARYALPNESREQAFAGILDRLQRGGAEGVRIAEELAPLISARHPSQLYQAAAEGLALSLSLLLVWARPRKPGVVGAWFLIVYGVLRIATEFWRLPDAHLSSPEVLGLSRGQWFSLLMVAIGAFFLVRISKRDTERLGGWLIGPHAIGSGRTATDPIEAGRDER